MNEDHSLYNNKMKGNKSLIEFYKSNPHEFQTQFIKKKTDYLNLNIKPFNFQYELAAHGVNGVNNIVCLRTGAGKTLISAIICKHWYKVYERENKLNKFKVAFIVPTRALAEQQYEAFKPAFPEINEDNDILQMITERINEEQIASYLQESNIIFLTAQKLVNSINKNKLKISDFCILIFDECHHTTELHPYSEIMNLYYQNTKLQNDIKPLIIGLTASLGVGKGISVLDHLATLCANLDSENISSLTDKHLINELKEKIPSPHTDSIVEVEISPSYQTVLRAINDNIISITNLAELDVSNIKVGSQEFESFIATTKTSAENISKARHMVIVLKYLNELNLLFMRLHDLSILYCLNDFRLFFNSSKVDEPTEIEILVRQEVEKLMIILEQNKNEENQKLLQLVDNICQSHSNKDSKGLILVRTRYHTKGLADFLSNNQKLQDFGIKCSRLTGQGSNEDLCMTSGQQNISLENFRNGIANLLIATDIAQEGLDVPQCNYVIRYEFVSNEIGTVQSRGRARADGSKCYLITDKDSLNCKREKGNRIKEKQMYEALKLWNETPASDFEELFECQKKALMESHEKREEKISSTDNKSKDCSEFRVFCKACSQFLCEASEIFHRDPNYICISQEFSKSKIQINYETKKFKCSNKSCERELGVLILFAKGKLREAYNLNIKSIKFSDEKRQKPVIFSSYGQWSKIPFSLKKLNY